MSAARVRIETSWPPNINDIRKVFPVTEGVIFAWGPDTIHNPSGNTLPPELIAHERVHHRQQGEDVEGWWARYLADPEWRLEQEIEAHRAEWRAYQRQGKSATKRRKKLAEIAGRLASPLYGLEMTPTEARTLILSIQDA